MAVDLKSHPGLNPVYFEQMEKRQAAILANKSALRSQDGFPLMRVPVPKQPNKYIPHIGAKQLAKAAKPTPPQPIKGDEK